MGMNDDEQTSMGGHLWTDVKWKDIGRGMSNGMATHIERNNNTHQMKRQCMTNGTKHNQWRRHCKVVRVCELSNDGL
jgi:hypothetical protein